MIFSSSLELKVFLSARDYALSVQFYREVGFDFSLHDPGGVLWRIGHALPR
ncbi:VOC family protein [Xanthomonas graminis]|uniref:hypothetical protein n=1 Tax=Xanthomonas graminis TaxID=3390026 RepID=UPI001F46A1CF|nr:hypothetical protein [Xanthomonas translucens]UKE72654.1 hypothetical protein KFS85_16705 [Xanthomonas translucens pv. phleipratensis]